MSSMLVPPRLDIIPLLYVVKVGEIFCIPKSSVSINAQVFVYTAPSLQQIG